MNEKKIEKVIIVGAGLAGLTAADVLTSAGIHVDIFEKQPYLGGLASTFYDRHLFADAGPHRFHTSDEKVLSYIKNVLKSECYTIRRFSGVRAFNKYHNWPLTINSLFRLPLKIMIKSGIDLFFRPRITDQSFCSYIVNKYGKTLYTYFFKGYTEKFIKLDPIFIHADWAKAGLDRAIIDKRIKMNSLFDIARRMLFPRMANTEFIYPKGGGIDVFSRRLADRVTAQGGSINLGSVATASKPGNDGTPHVMVGGKQLDADLVLWTAPLPELLSGLELQYNDLNYLTTIIYQVICDFPPKLPYQWCYFGDLETIFCRVSINAHFSPEAAPKGKHILTVEVTGMSIDNFVHNPQILKDKVIADLRTVGAIPRISDIVDVHVIVLDNTYPIYTTNYQENLFKALSQLDDFPTYIPLGRTGSFWYNNMDHSIAQAMQQAQAIVTGSKTRSNFNRDFWTG